MRTIETTVYQFSELSDSAKEKARNWARSLDLYAWCDDSRESIKAFCRHFGVELKTWNIGPWYPIEYTTDVENRHFRGYKLDKADRDRMPTGYCLDADLWVTFYDEFKHTGNAKVAFNAAIHAGFKAWRDDWEYSLSDEALDALMLINEYEFTEDGERV